MVQTLTRVTDEVMAEIAEEKRVRRTDEVFLLFAMGSQFDHLIKQQLDKLGVYCLVADPSRVTADDVRKLGPIGIILSGGPVSVHTDPPPFDAAIFNIGIPVLGICLGFQLWAQHVGLKVERSDKREFGTHPMTLTGESLLFAGIHWNEILPVLQSHGDAVEESGEVEALGCTEHSPLAAARHKVRTHLWGVQFHPEVTETTHGPQIFDNFCFEICGAKDRYPAEAVAEQKVAELKKQIGDKKVLLALSGGSDSSVVAFLLKAALAGRAGNEPQVTAIYVCGIDLLEDELHVEEYFGNEPWLKLKVVDATKEFLAALAGKETMKEKRLAMRGVYKTILEDEARACGAHFIAQGTLYTDISESGGGYNTGARKAEIKLHHNTNLGFSLPELTPLDDCVKDSARNIGRSVGTPEALLIRHPFPGPGLVVRIEGEVTETNLAIARMANGIYESELKSWGLYDTVWQNGAVVTRSVTTCTKGDDAASGVVVALWAVWSVNGFTAQAADLPSDFLRVVAKRITNEIREVGAVVYRISDKPPATIEWG